MEPQTYSATLALPDTMPVSAAAPWRGPIRTSMVMRIGAWLSTGVQPVTALLVETQIC